MNKKPIYVTQPFLPPIEEYTKLLNSVWESGILTHNGPLVQRFEKELCGKLNIDNFVAVTNGTIALQMAIKALGLKGEIITTPFTWIATISAIQWEGCTPIFCDIDPETLNIDPNKIQECISENTVAIMPVHVFGNPCSISQIDKIAKENGLQVIYDAAHAIGSTYKRISVLEFGDISATSLHATKLLNTAEGGGCVTTNFELHDKLKRIRFFGHNDEKDVVEEGFNGKMTEVHAALGIANLKFLEVVLKDRKIKYNHYINCLSKINRISFQKHSDGCSNYSYFPLIFETEEQLLITVEKLKKENIFPRRYFFPSVNTYEKLLAYSNCPISENISKRILCLPLYKGLDISIIDFICDMIASK